ncbi:LacI family DNA-binding transcriptional regulator [Demequina globuliformis]|uniref:LacI family DNA-binding transcriptional regulator n=1 Tax=Demequina globuliformis TaxID=676202 RepID=UPI000785115F|nr:LacI family DNA-binding transcriptional regulator [Demequina globuliformis]
MTKTSGPKRATSWDVARLSGFSRSTVNEILNGRGERFPEATRARVHQAVDELAYAPSPAGRGLVTGRGSTVVVLVPAGTLPPLFQDSIVELQAVLSSRGFHVLVQFGISDSDAIVTDLRMLAPVAIVNFNVLAPGAAEQLRRTGVVVVPDSGESELDEFDVHVGSMLVQTLVERVGRRRLLFARPADAVDYPSGMGRFRGALQAAAELRLDPPTLVEVPLDVATAARILEPVLSHDKPTSIACQVDVVALAVLAACRELGLEVPSEVAIMGVDATPESQLWSPRLTTFRIDQGEVGRGLGANLISAIDGDEAGAHAAGFPQLRVVEGDTA